MKFLVKALGFLCPLFFSVLLLTLSLSAAAEERSPAQSDYCRHSVASDGEIQDSYFQSRSQNLDFRMGFRNQGGMFGGGTCWWHSEFTRNAIYLAVFRPELQPPTPDEAYELAKELMKADNVVEIPGFQSLSEFTHTHESTLQRVLNEAQAHDAFFLGWPKGLVGSNHVDAGKLERRMDELFDLVVHQHHIVYQMLQMPGLAAHAWLVIDMSQTTKSGGGVSGYKLLVIDSNFNDSTQEWSYEYGDQELLYGNKSFVPYTQLEKEHETYSKKIRRYCR